MRYFSMVILSSLNSNQETKLLAILKSYKNSIGWNIADIKGINLLICTHCTYLKEDIKPFWKPQRRLNSQMKDVVRNELLKLLDVGIIYPIANGKWVSPTQVVPKTSGVVVAKMRMRNWYQLVSQRVGEFVLTIESLILAHEKTIFHSHLSIKF